MNFVSTQHISFLRDMKSVHLEMRPNNGSRVSDMHVFCQFYFVILGSCLNKCIIVTINITASAYLFQHIWKEMVSNKILMNDAQQRSRLRQYARELFLWGRRGISKCIIHV